jgi:hypothetical protein
MIPLQKIPPTKDSHGKLREFSLYAQIKNDFVYVTNGYALIKVPAEKVFGKEAAALLPIEESYFPLEQWKIGKFDKADQIQVAGDHIKAVDKKGSVTGDIQLASKSDIKFRFPDCDPVIHNMADFEYQASLDTAVLGYALNSFSKSDSAVLRFRTHPLGSPGPVSIISPNAADVEAIIMPVVTKGYDFGKKEIESRRSNDAPDTKDLEIEKLNAQLAEKDKEIEVLEDELKKWTDDAKEDKDADIAAMDILDSEIAAPTGNGDTLYYRIEKDNLLDIQIMEAFAKCLSGVKPLDLLHGLETILEYKIVY